MPGDARRKGGSYSSNPATMRTRAYQASLTPEKAAERKKKFAEYRSLRETCIRISNTDAYKDEPTRDGKLQQLRQACHKLMADRVTANKPTCGTDIEDFAKRFHDTRWLKKHKTTTASSSKAQNHQDASIDNEADGSTSNEEAKPMDIKDVEITIGEHFDAIADLVNNETEIATQLNAVSNQVLHLSEIATIQQARLETIEDPAQKDREAFNSVLMVLAECDDL